MSSLNSLFVNLHKYAYIFFSRIKNTFWNFLIENKEK